MLQRSGDTGLPPNEPVGSKVSICWAGKAVTYDSGHLTTQVSIGRPFAPVILTSVFFTGGGTAFFWRALSLVSLPAWTFLLVIFAIASCGLNVVDS